MKILYPLFFLILLFPAISQAQDAAQSSDKPQSFILYQWPKNGDLYVPQTTTFIIRPTRAFMNTHTAANFTFIVNGALSGEHAGKILTSDDNEAIIFKPDQPFALDEIVQVDLHISGEQNLAPISYSFTTTSMSETDRGRALFDLHEHERAEYQAAREEMQISAEKSEEAIQSVPLVVNDSIVDRPAVVIDTTKIHEAGNVFFTPDGQLPFAYSFLGITSDTGTSPLFRRDIPVGCGNFKMEPDGTMSYFRELNGTYNGLGIFFGRYERIDQNMNIIDTFITGNGFVTDEHDFHFMPKNKHAIIISYDPQTFNMKQLPCSLDTFKTNARVFGAIIQELDGSKNVVKQWRSWDHYSICDATADINLGTGLIDPFHLNTAEIDSTDGNLIASFRHLDAIVKINWKDGDPNLDSTIWHWGGKHNNFTFTGPNPGDTLKFSHQHDPARLANGHITLWDNGNLHTKIVNSKPVIVPSSRAVEYTLDETNHVATVVWDYSALPYSLAAGNVQRLDNGNTMIGLGFATNPSAVEVTPAKERIFQMSMATNAFAYRTYRFTFTPPVINAVHQTGPANSFDLVNIFPNPAQNAATIHFSIQNPGMIQIELLDVLGHSFRSMSERLSAAGAYSADLDVHDLPSGTYYCKLSQGGSIMTKMIVVQK